MGRVPVLRRGGLGVYVHVDDVGVMGDGPRTDRVTQLLLAIVTELRAVGFKVTDIKLPGSVERFVGFAPVLNPARLVLPAAKAALLHETLGWLLSQAVVDVDAVDSALGILVWACSVRREVLSVLSACFIFVEKLRGRKARWWPNAWDELNQARALIPLLFASLGAPLSDLIGATDAMGGQKSTGIAAALESSRRQSPTMSPWRP